VVTQMDREKQIRDWLSENIGDAPAELAGRVRERLATRPASGAGRAWRWALATGFLAVVIVTAAVFEPRIALANTLRQVHAAIVNAKTMRVDCFDSRNGAPARHFMTTCTGTATAHGHACWHG